MKGFWILTVTLLITLPYLATIFIRGVKILLEEVELLRGLIKMFIYPLKPTAPTEEDRMNRELDKIEKRQTGQVTRLPESVEGQWVGTPSPKEEAKATEVKLLDEQRKLKEKLEKDIESDQ